MHWLTQQTSRGKEIPNMNITIKAIASCMDIQECMTGEEIRLVNIDDEYLSMLSDYILHGLLSTRGTVQRGLQPCWSLRNAIGITYGITMTGKRIILPTSIQIMY